MRLTTWTSGTCAAALALTGAVVVAQGPPAGSTPPTHANLDYAAADPVMRPTFVRLVNTDLRAIMPRIRASTFGRDGHGRPGWGSRANRCPVLDHVRQGGVVWSGVPPRLAWLRLP